MSGKKNEMAYNKMKYVYIDFFRAGAAILIINSHLDSLYPISALATGGAIGNALFFFASGFCMYPVGESFMKWFFTKALRVYIPTLPILLLSAYIEGDWPTGSHILSYFIWPTSYWFIGAILLFYILYYVLRRISTKGQYVFLFTLLFFVSGVYYMFLDTSAWVIETPGLNSKEGYYKLIYYFAIMMMGKWFAQMDDIRISEKVCILCAAISVLSLYGMKYMMNKSVIFMQMQFLNQVSIVLFVFFIAALMIKREKVKKFEGKRSVIVTFICQHTLEMYLVQFLIIRLCRRFVFPINVVLTIALIVTMAVLLKLYDTKVFRVISSRLQHSF